MRGIQVPWMLKQPNAYSSLWHDTCINFENYYYGINNYLKSFYSKFKTNPLGFGHKYASGDAMDDVSIKIYCCNYTKIALIDSCPIGVSADACPAGYLIEGVINTIYNKLHHILG